jgi:heat shock protein HslJ
MKKIILMAMAAAMFACTSQKEMTTATTPAGTAAAKAADGISDTRWELIEINGQPVKDSIENVFGVKAKAPKAFIELNSKDGRVSASGGCNTMGGSFTLQSEVMRIRFSEIFSTEMACINTNYDAELGKVLSAVDNYSLSEDGKTLSLNRARMAPLARFVAVK